MPRGRARSVIGSRARDRAAGSYTECAAGPRQPSALRSASLLVHRILLGTPQGQTQLGTLQLLLLLLLSLLLLLLRGTKYTFITPIKMSVRNTYYETPPARPPNSGVPE